MPTKEKWKETGKNTGKAFSIRPVNRNPQDRKV